MIRIAEGKVKGKIGNGRPAIIPPATRNHQSQNSPPINNPRTTYKD